METEGRIVKPPRIPRTCNCGGVGIRQYHKHADGSHWCDYCGGYCGSSSVHGSDMADANHPVHCECKPCPHKSMFDCYGMRFYSPETAELNAKHIGD